MKRFLVVLLAGLLLATPAAASTARIFITSGTTWTVPADWNSQDNTIEIIGAGGGGLDCGFASSFGGGGGGYSKIVNFVATPGASVPISFTPNSSGVGGFASLGSGPSVKAAYGNDYLKVCVSGGAALGGQASAGIGTTKHNGGDGGFGTGGGNGTGSGGGAAGPHGGGAQPTPLADGGVGGTADAGFGGAGGNVGAGGNGTEFDASHGAGGGGGSDGAGTGGPGGNYGGGGAYAQGGGPALIVITYTTRNRVSSGVF